MTSLPVLILAGGLGTRIKSLSGDLPKALIPVNGKPFLAYQLELIRSQGIKDVVLSVGYQGKMIEDTFSTGKDWGLSIKYVYDGDKLLGTAGAIKKALPLLGSAFFVIYGDSYLPIDFRQVERAYMISKKAALMTIFLNQGQWDRSNVVFQGGEIKVYDKKVFLPEMQYIDYGLSILSPKVFADVGTDEKVDLEYVFKWALAKRELAAFEVSSRFYEIGSPQGFNDFAMFVANS